MGAVEPPEAEGETRDPFSEGELSTLLSYLSQPKTPTGSRCLHPSAPSAGLENGR